MSHVPHDLTEMLEVDHATLQAKAAADRHFGRQIEEYQALNRAIHRAETDVEPTAEATLHDMKRQRLALLDTMRHALVA